MNQKEKHCWRGDKADPGNPPWEVTLTGRALPRRGEVTRAVRDNPRAGGPPGGQRFQCRPAIYSDTALISASESLKAIGPMMPASLRRVPDLNSISCFWL